MPAMPLPITTSFCFVNLSSMVCLSVPTAPRHDASSVVVGGRFLRDFCEARRRAPAVGTGGSKGFISRRVPIASFHFIRQNQYLTERPESASHLPQGGLRPKLRLDRPSIVQCGRESLCGRRAVSRPARHARAE